MSNNNYGSSKSRLWWLGKPVFSVKLMKKRYYFTEHIDYGFKVTVLKLHLVGKKVTIGILNNKNERLYSFDLRPGQNVIFSINSKNYQFFYKEKSFKKGVKFYPEINYYLLPYDCSNISYN